MAQACDGLGLLPADSGETPKAKEAGGSSTYLSQLTILRANLSNIWLHIAGLFLANLQMSIQNAPIFVFLVAEYAYLLFLRLYFMCFHMTGKFSFPMASKKHFSTKLTVIMTIQMFIQRLLRG